MQVASWGTCPTEVEALGGLTALPWQAEVAELIVQLESITWHGSKLLPGSLVQRVWGLSLAAMLHRCVAAMHIAVHGALLLCTTAVLVTSLHHPLCLTGWVCAE